MLEETMNCPLSIDKLYPLAKGGFNYPAFYFTTIFQHIGIKQSISM